MWTNIWEPPDLSKITNVNLCDIRLTKIPDWISKCNNLIGLNCSHNKITQIPNILPNSLQKFSCCHNKITQIPDTLPNSLQVFYCWNNKITQIPDTLPDSLKTFHCNDNKITQIPLLIIQLQKLTEFYRDENAYESPLIEYFLDNLNNKNIKKQCYDLMWKIRMEF